MPEWSNGLDSKSSDGLVPSVGSNPTPSATTLKSSQLSFFVRKERWFLRMILVV